MKIFIIFNRVLRAATFVAPLITVLLMTSCASTAPLTQSSTNLPIETKSSTPGVVVSAHSFERHGRLFISGTWKKTPGYAHHYAAHVDIQLISREGTILASVRDEIDPAPSIRVKVRNSRVAFVGSFPAETARKADRIRIIAHAHETE
jgi:hypothetical protein